MLRPAARPAALTLAAPAACSRRRAALLQAGAASCAAAWLHALHRDCATERLLAAAMAAPRFTVQRLDDVDLTFNGRFHIHRELNRARHAACWARAPSAAQLTR